MSRAGGRSGSGMRWLVGVGVFGSLACVASVGSLAGCGSIVGYESDYRVVDAAGGRSGAAGQGGASFGGAGTGGRAGLGGETSGSSGNGAGGKSGSGAAGGSVVGGAAGSTSGGTGGGGLGGAGGSVSGGAGGSPPVEEDLCAASATCGVLYVSASTGDDAADGCSLAKPLRTVDAAVKRANANAAVSCVSACIGSYATSGISITRPYVLRGARDCATGAGRTWGGQEGNPPAEATNIVVASGAGPVGVTITADGAKLQDLQVAWSFPATDDASTVAAVRVEKKATLLNVAALVLERATGLPPRASAGILVVSGGDPAMRGTYGAGAGQLTASVPKEPSVGLRVEPGGRFGVTESTFVGGEIALTNGALPSEPVSVGVWDRSGASVSTYGLVATGGRVQLALPADTGGTLVSAGYWLAHVHNFFDHARLAGGPVSGNGRSAALLIAPTGASLPSDKVEISRSRLLAGTVTGLSSSTFRGGDSLRVKGGRVVVSDSVLFSPAMSGGARLVAASNDAKVEIARSTLVGGKVASGEASDGGSFALVLQSDAATAKLTDVLLVSLGLAGSPFVQSLASCDAPARSGALGSLSLDHVTVLAPRGAGSLLRQATADGTTSCAAFTNVDDASAALAAAGSTPVSFGWLTSTKTAGGGVLVPGCLDKKAEDCANALLQDPLPAGAALSKSGFAPTCDALVVYPNQLTRKPSSETLYDVVDKARKPGGAIGAFEPSCP